MERGSEIPAYRFIYSHHTEAASRTLVLVSRMVSVSSVSLLVPQKKKRKEKKGKKVPSRLPSELKLFLDAAPSGGPLRLGAVSQLQRYAWLPSLT